MFAQLKKLIAPPLYDDVQEQRIVNILNTLAWVGLAVTIPIVLLGFIISSSPLVNVALRTLPLVFFMVISLWIMHGGRLRLASYLFTYPIWILLLLFAFVDGGIKAPTFSSAIIVIMVASFLLGMQSGLQLAVLTILGGVLMIMAEYQGWLPAPLFVTTPILYWLSEASSLIVAATLFSLFINSLGQTIEQLNEANQKLLQNQYQQEGLILERTRALQLGADVSRQLSTILDTSDLVNAVVQQVQHAFDYYRVHIYLVDESGQNLVLAAGTGISERTLPDHPAVPVGSGLVGIAAQTRHPVLVPDVTEDDRWQPDPHLPETRAEVIVPIMTGNELNGVLDVQHNVRGSLNASDVDLLRLIANQVAIALQNARSYQAAQHQAVYEYRINKIGQKIQHAGTIEEVLAVAASELGQALDVQQTAVLLNVVSAATMQPQ